MRILAMRVVRQIGWLGLLLAWLHAVPPARAQPSYRLTGTVTDASNNEPLPGVHIFLASRQQGTTTDRNGAYTIEGIESGAYQVVISMVGFNPAVAQVQLIGESTHFRLDVSLNPIVYALDGVEVVDEVPREWQKLLERFNKFFLGRSENAVRSTILNPEVLDFRDDDSGFYATASEPLVIENRGLGYRVTFLLTEFRIDKTNGLRYTNGYWRLEPLEPKTRSEESAWRQRRERAFLGSMQHLLWSLVHAREEAEGFRITLDDREDAPFAGAYLRRTGNITGDEIIEPSESGHYLLRFPGFLRVDYTRYDNNGRLFQRRMPPQRQLSYIKLNSPVVNVHTQGYIYSLGQGVGLVTAYGYMASQGAADLLPQEYADQRNAR
ncbi:MAG: carboxypeptidase-like regulatory domain-containing protein [Rhodothermales bacterium]